MKTLNLIFIAFATFQFMSCNTNKVNILSEQDKEAIKSEILAINEHVIESSETVNFEKMIEPFADDPEFISITNGEIINYEGWKESNKEYFENLDKQSFNLTIEKITIINKETAILTLGGSAQALLKDGNQIKFDPFAATVVLRKIDDFWEVIHIHESGIFTPIVEDSTSIE